MSDSTDIHPQNEPHMESFNTMTKVNLPAIVIQVASIDTNRVIQLLYPACTEKVDLQPYKEPNIEGYTFVLADGRSVLVVTHDSTDTQTDYVLKVEDLTKPDRWTTGEWLRPTESETSSSEEVLVSWKGRFTVIEEEEGGASNNSPGLRPPQVGALYATLAHWKVHQTEATIVLPTGTGKTDTMLAIYAHACLNKLLVIVPTDALRTQLGRKFLNLGILKEYGLLPAESIYPRVGYLTKGLSSGTEVLEFISQSNVVVSTMDAINACKADAKRALHTGFSHMFVDEAHHLGALSWDDFRRGFSGASIQFTATPFRRDGKRLPGKVIFNYPLRLAQEAGYFSRINFRSILEFDDERHDREIAKVAIEQLSLDDQKGYKHVVLARCERVKRAEEVIKIYREIAPSYKPVILHSKLPTQEKESSIESLLKGDSRIVVCVDMFGEGFDYPALKIGAMHDAHKSIGITLQFTGRFARNNPDLGEATVIANLAHTKTHTPNILQKLYTEDADWNTLLHIVSSDTIHTEIKVQEFMADFSSPSDSSISVSNLTPAASIMAYDVRDHSPWVWRPERIEEAFEQDNIIGSAHINTQDNVVFLIVRNPKEMRWGSVSSLFNVTHDLYIAYYHEEHDLVFVYSSGNNNTKQRRVAQKLLRDNTPSTIKGDTSFRVFGDVHRLRLINLGLRETLNRRVSFRAFMGPDIKEGIDVLEQRNRVMTNVFGKGYQDGQTMDYGAGRRGRIWSYRTTDSLLEWKEWCDQVAPRIRNDNYTPEQILSRVLVPTQVSKVPPNHEPLSVTWNEDLWLFNEARKNYIGFYDERNELIANVALLYTDITLDVSYCTSDSFLFDVVGTLDGGEPISARYRANITDEGMSYVHENGCIIKFSTNNRGSSTESALEEFFSLYPPTFRFVSGSLLIENMWLEIEFDRSMSFDKSTIKAWNWSSVNISNESAWKNGAVVPDSIQMKVLTELTAQGFELVINDDGAGESADVVAMHVDEKEKVLHVHLYHLKFSAGTKPGTRVKDLYEVCGQAQRSVHWKEHIEDLFNHLQARISQASRRNPRFDRYFEGGNTELRRCRHFATLFELKFEIFIVQPGIKKSMVSEEQLELLTATRSYLHQTLLVPLHVITSP
jgi:superfamily II DNA or RNA helicase